VSIATADSTPETSKSIFKPGLTSRAIAAMSGTRGLAVKIVLLSLTNALAAWAAVVLIGRSDWIALVVLLAATAVVDVVYLLPRRWTVPAKFLVPGTIFLIAFQIVPIAYTINVAFSNYSTGHVINKADAIKAIEQNSLQAPANGRQFAMAPAEDSSGKLVMILRDNDSGATYLGTKKGLTSLPQSSVTVDESGQPTAAKGYTLLKGAKLFALAAQLQNFDMPTSGAATLQPQGVTQAVELEPTLRYEPKRDVFVRISDGAIFHDNHRGEFVATANPANALEPGWRSYTGFHNFGKLATNPLYRAPFLRVFAWTIVFASLVVLISFAAGLFLAIALDKQGMRGQRVYRSSLLIPYAIPGFLSLLVWGGLLNDDFGVVNHLFHTHIPFLFNGTWARASVIFVSVWLTVPYFFLVSLGALQSIPSELTEAARVDGGGGWQIFRRVTLPLLLVAVAPLMIASFALNFNNFNNIYLLTGGGPYDSNSSSVAGSTDILISYTYKLAIASGKGQDFGLGSSVAIIIFLIVASISSVSFWRSKSLENMR
jgi:arabinogalactan oligomer/maltooligosaccharide transport system permease protein